MLALIFYAVYTREQFYPSILFLVTSKVSYVVGGNLVFAVAFFVAHFLKSLFLENLSESENELLADKAKYTIVETCLALTIFRAELTPTVICYFGGLLFLNAFHWLAKARIERLDQVMPAGYSKHVRLLALLLLLCAVDLYVCQRCVAYTIANGKSVVILFCFEFGILIVSVFNMCWRYLLHGLDSWLTHGLLSKGVYLMVGDLLCDAMRFVTYVFFFGLVFVYYGVPIYLMRELWSSFYILQKNVTSFVKYLRLTSNLDQRFPSATAEELATVEDCLICREPMSAGKKLPCGHIFHLPCLRVWLQHQQWCPLCRAEIPMQPAQVLDASQLPQVAGAQIAGVAAQAPPPDANAAAGAVAAADLPAYHAHRAHDSPHDAAHRERVSAGSPRSPSSASTTAVGLDSPVGAHGTTSSHPTGVSRSLPRFYYVSTAVCAVHLEPTAASGVLRTLLQGTVLFVQDIRTDPTTGIEWARIPDGWVVSGAHGDSEGHYLLPYDEFTEREYVIHTPLYTPISRLPGSRSSGGTTRSQPGSGRRVEQMLLLQERLRALSEGVFAVQQDLAELVESELEQQLEPEIQATVTPHVNALPEDPSGRGTAGHVLPADNAGAVDAPCVEEPLTPVRSKLPGTCFFPPDPMGNEPATLPPAATTDTTVDSVPLAPWETSRIDGLNPHHGRSPSSAANAGGDNGSNAAQDQSPAVAAAAASVLHLPQDSLRSTVGPLSPASHEQIAMDTMMDIRELRAKKFKQATGGTDLGHSKSTEQDER